MQPVEENDCVRSPQPQLDARTRPRSQGIKPSSTAARR
jgi:hypothetical protein